MSEQAVVERTMLDKILEGLEGLSPDERYALAVLDELTRDQRLRLSVALGIAARLLAKVAAP